MSSIFFMAVQCCQCSTMQVKQRKKSNNSNKWTCVVCYQKQSIRKVFAQGPMAKDLRLFVQSFNMSRQFQHHHSSASSEEEPQLQHRSPADCKRRRTDWTKFLDPYQEVCEEVERGVKSKGGFEPEIVTELPEGLLKRVKLNRNADASGDGGGGGDELYKPVFSKRNSNKQVLSQDKEPRNLHDLITDKHNSKLGHYKTREDYQKSRKCEINKGREASKWSDYITQDDDDDDYDNDAVNDQAGDSSNHVFQTLTNEEKIEDDEIHPDFL